MYKTILARFHWPRAGDDEGARVEIFFDGEIDLFFGEMLHAVVLHGDLFGRDAACEGVMVEGEGFGVGLMREDKLVFEEFFKARHFFLGDSFFGDCFELAPGRGNSPLKVFGREEGENVPQAAVRFGNSVSTGVDGIGESFLFPHSAHEAAAETSPLAEHGKAELKRQKVGVGECERKRVADVELYVSFSGY